MPRLSIERRDHSTEKKLAAVRRAVIDKVKIAEVAKDAQITSGLMSKWIARHEKEVRKLERERKANGANGAAGHVVMSSPMNGSSHGSNGATPPVNAKEPGRPAKRDDRKLRIARAVARMDAGEPTKVIAKEFKVSPASLYLWRKQVRAKPAEYALDAAAPATAAVPAAVEGGADASALAALTKRYTRLREATNDAVAWLKLGERDIDDRKAARKLHGTDYAHAMLLAAKAELERA